MRIVEKHFGCSRDGQTGEFSWGWKWRATAINDRSQWKLLSRCFPSTLTFRGIFEFSIDASLARERRLITRFAINYRSLVTLSISDKALSSLDGLNVSGHFEDFPRLRGVQFRNWKGIFMDLQRFYSTFYVWNAICFADKRIKRLSSIKGFSSSFLAFTKTEVTFHSNQIFIFWPIFTLRSFQFLFKHWR